MLLLPRTALAQSWRLIARAGFSMLPTASENTLVVFSIDAKSGALTFVQRIGCGGKNPRDFTLDPSEKWLVAANQDTQNIVVFARDPHTRQADADQS